MDVAAQAGDGEHLARIYPYDLIILDVMLPDRDGMQLCRDLRNRRITSPVLILTAKSGLKDKVSGLNAGADDYLAKPFEFEELLARSRALIRRSRIEKTTKLHIADLELDQLTHKVARGGREIELTAREYSLLQYLMMNANQVVTRTMISEQVWNESFDTYTNVIDVYVNYLRAKIDKDFETPLIHTIRG